MKTIHDVHAFYKKLLEAIHKLRKEGKHWLELPGYSDRAWFQNPNREPGGFWSFDPFKRLFHL